jgi:hypothetical protein
VNAPLPAPERLRVSELAVEESVDVPDGVGLGWELRRVPAARGSASGRPPPARSPHRAPPSRRRRPDRRAAARRRRRDEEYWQTEIRRLDAGARVDRVREVTHDDLVIEQEDGTRAVLRLADGSPPD